MKSLKYILSCLILSLATLSTTAQDYVRVNVHKDGVITNSMRVQAIARMRVEEDLDAPRLVGLSEDNQCILVSEDKRIATAADVFSRHGKHFLKVNIFQSRHWRYICLV